MISVEKKFAFSGHGGAVYALEQGPEPGMFFSGGSDMQVVSWNLDTHATGEVWCSVPGIIYVIRHDPVGKMLYIGQSLGGVHVIDLVSRKEVRHLAWHTGPVFDLLISQKHQLLVSAGGDGILHFFSLVDFRHLGTLGPEGQKVRSLLLSKDEELLFAGTQDGRISVIRLNGLKIEHQWQAHLEGFSVNALAWLPGNLLVSGSRDACMVITDTEREFQQISRIAAHNYAIYQLALSPDGRFLASASRDKSLKIWDIADMKVLKRVDGTSGGHINSVNRLLWMSDSRRLLSTGDDRAILEWQVSF